MEKRISQQVKVGIFVLVGLLITMSIIFMLGREKKLFESKYRLTAYFTDISGLRVGAPVYLAGIIVGSVDSINFTDDIKRKDVRVVMQISHSYQTRIRHDSEASILTQGLLGDKMVFINVGSPEHNKLKDGDVMKGVNVPSITEYFDKAGSLLDNFNKVAHNVNRMLEGEEGEENKKSFVGIMKSLDRILAKVDKGEGLLHALIHDPQGRQIIHNLNSATANIARFFTNAEGQTMSQHVGRTFYNLGEATRDLRIILDRIEKGDGTVGGLVNDPTVYYELRTLLGKANRNKIVRSVIRGTLKAQDKALNE